MFQYLRAGSKGILLLAGQVTQYPGKEQKKEITQFKTQVFSPAGFESGTECELAMYASTARVREKGNGAKEIERHFFPFSFLSFFSLAPSVINRLMALLQCLLGMSERCAAANQRNMKLGLSCQNPTRAWQLLLNQLQKITRLTPCPFLRLSDLNILT